MNQKITRTEARLIAEELYKLAHRDINKILLQAKEDVAEASAKPEELYNLDEAAKYLKRSRPWLYRNKDRIPHTQECRKGRIFFYRSQLDKFISNI